MTVCSQANGTGSGSGTTVDAARLRDARNLLNEIATQRSNHFTGVGVVFYVELHRLPHLQLTSELTDPNPAQFDGQDIATVLSSISTQSCALHDGFHFVEARSWRLTHLSQFISPPIPGNASERFHGTGARLMAAALASVLPGICHVGLVSQAGDVHLFLSGTDATKDD